jgi:hypothetical protein
VTLDAVIRDSPEAAYAAWSRIAARHGIEQQRASDGSPRDLDVGGPVGDVAPFLDDYARLGIGEVMFTFRDPFDLETIERVGELRAALRS